MYNSDTVKIVTIPVIKSSGERKSVLIDHMVLNGGKELTALEKASAVRELRELGMKYQDIGKVTGMGQQTAFNLASFAEKASSELIQAVESGKMTITTATKIISDSAGVKEQNEKLHTAAASAEAKGKSKIANSDVPLKKRQFGKQGFINFYTTFAENTPEASAQELYDAVCSEFGFRDEK